MSLKYTVFLAIMLTTGLTVTSADEKPWHVAMSSADSLKRLLDVGPITEKRRSELYQGIANAFSSNEQDSMLHWALKGVHLARKLKEYDHLITCYRFAGAGHCFRANYDSAFFYFDLLKSLSIELGNKRAEKNALAFYAYTYKIQGKYNTAIDHYLKVLKMNENDGDTEGSITILINLVEINRKLGNTETAFRYLEEAERTSRQMVGHVAYDWRMTSILNEYAFNYLHRGELDMALHYALQSDNINRNRFVVNQCTTLGILATIWLQRADSDRAMQYALQSYEWADRLKDKNLYAYAGKILSDVYMAQKRYPEAEAVALKVWMADSTYIDESRDAVGNIVLANIYMRQTERAAYYLKKYTELNTQYSEKSFQTTVSDMMIKYDTEKKEMRIASLQKERRLYTGFGIAGGLLAVVLGIALWQQQRNAQKEKQLIATRSILDGEMKERTRMSQDLHDRLSGNFSSMKIELSKNTESKQNFQELLDKCIRDIRDTSHNLMPVSLQFGMKVALEDLAAKFTNVSFYFFGTEKRISERMEYVVYCCASELVNNAVKHSGANNINMQLIQDAKHITLTVADNGCGFDEKTVKKGLGLKSIRNRVVSCNGKIDVVSSPENGTETTIELRIEN